MRQHSIPALVQIPDSANLADVVSRRAADQPQQVALRRSNGGGTWQDVTAGRFRDEVTALAKGLIAAGIAAGDRVGLMSRTRYEWTLLDYAIWTAGAVIVPVYETSSAEQVEWIMSDSGAKAIFVETAAHEAIVAGLRDRLSALEHVWRIEAARLRPGGRPGPPGRGRQGPRAGHAGRRRRVRQRRRGAGGPRRPAPPTWPRSSTPPAPPGAPRAAS